MPLSKARNRGRMRLTRLHALLVTPKRIKPVQPKPDPENDGDVIFPPKYSRMMVGRIVSRKRGEFATDVELDADGQPIPEL